MGKNFKTYATRYAIIIGFVALVSSAVSGGNSPRFEFKERTAPTLAQLQRKNDLLLDLIYTREKLLSKKHPFTDSASN